MSYIFLLTIIFFSYIYRSLILYCFLYLYDKYKNYQEYINSKKISFDYVDNNNVYHNTNLSLKKIRQLNYKYIILNFKNKKFIYSDNLDIKKLEEKLKKKTKNIIVCANILIYHNILQSKEYDFHSELSKFFVDDITIDLKEYKSLWISLINKKYNTNYDLSYSIKWFIITDKIKTYNSYSLIIKVIDNLVNIEELNV